MTVAVDMYVKTHSKSHVVSGILTVVLGPIGLFYSSWVAALILTVIAIASFQTIFIPIACWILAIGIGVWAVSKHNKKVMAVAALGAERAS